MFNICHTNLRVNIKFNQKLANPAINTYKNNITYQKPMDLF